MYKESSNCKNNPGDLISDEPQKAPCCTQNVRAQSVFFHGSSDCSGQLAQTPWPTTRGRGLLRPDWVSLAVKSFNDLAQFFAIKNFSAARHIRVYTKHVHMLQLLHELFHLLLAVRAEAACATASGSSWASRSGSSNTRRAGATAAASRSSWANRSRSCSRRAGASAASRSSWGLIAAGSAKKETSLHDPAWATKKAAHSNRLHPALRGRTGTGESSEPESSEPAELTGESPRRCQRKSALIHQCTPSSV